ILKIHLKQASLSPTVFLNEIVRHLAQKTNGFSGAELRFLSDEAKLQALRGCKYEYAVPLSEECFEKALEVVLNNRVTNLERKK
ncbi:MAG: hypothetical protein WCO26_13070, partial [Deltaproteobacteria bacterium]